MTRHATNKSRSVHRIRFAAMTAGGLIATIGLTAAADIDPPGTGSGSAADLYKLTDLGALGGQQSSALAMNDRGSVVGWAETDPVTEVHAFIWRNGFMSDLGTLGGDWSEARDVNNLNQVVGIAGTADGRKHAFYWYDRVILDLNDLVQFIQPASAHQSKQFQLGRAPTSGHNGPGAGGESAAPGNPGSGFVPHHADIDDGSTHPSTDLDPASHVVGPKRKPSPPSTDARDPNTFPDVDSAYRFGKNTNARPESASRPPVDPGAGLPDRDADLGSTDAAAAVRFLDTMINDVMLPDNDAAANAALSRAITYLNSLTTDGQLPDVDAQLPTTDAAPQITNAFPEHTDPRTDPGAGPGVRAPLRELIEANAINDDGWILANGLLWADNEQHAILLIPATDSSPYAPRYSYVDLGELDGAAYSRGFDLNNDGIAVGASGDRAFSWKKGIMSELIGFGGSSCASAVNGAGMVAGSTGVSLGSQNAAVWMDGVQYDLSAVGGGASYANAINDSAFIVGSTSIGAFSYAMLWDDTFQAFDLTDVTSMPGNTFEFKYLEEANAIDAQQSIIGVGRSDDGLQRAFLLRAVR